MGYVKRLVTSVVQLMCKNGMKTMMVLENVDDASITDGDDLDGAKVGGTDVGHVRTLAMQTQTHLRYLRFTQCSVLVVWKQPLMMPFASCCTRTRCPFTG